MKFGAMRHRVERDELLVEGRSDETRQHWAELRQAWTSGWSPVRILVAGFGLGFVVGRNEPQAALGSIASKLGGIPKILQMISTISALFTAHRAQEASEQAERAADNAEEVAADNSAGAAMGPVPVDERTLATATVAPAQATYPRGAPRAAEAATELSEH